jgi:ribosomal protein S18 acetylase RimI-like enzyme
LFQEYAASLGVNLDFQDFDAELASLPGAYAPPRGTLLVAHWNGAAAGCVGLRPLADEVAELKRLYVRPGFRGCRIGWDLTAAAVTAARAAGYQRVRLDTLPTMTAARSMYQRFGFTPIPPTGTTRSPALFSSS